MRTITVKRTLKAPIEKVFDVLSDHANYYRLPGIKRSTLTKKGKPGKNGLGAVREIDVGLAWFQEEITAYQRPTRMDYLITESRPPMAHKGSSIRLEKTPEGTLVTWTSTMRLDVPLLGGLLTPLLMRKLEKGFAATLKAIDETLA